ncbi:serine/threonine protein kinase [Archangium lipolyticum]|uniref:serine/threonine protein kinase n=1 Tax=Archangium lipolyticum TaxID=2970465 RepID=UPI002149D376|nr:serine/threonine-protein kinase [Archangium lipolyticum]
MTEQVLAGGNPFGRYRLLKLLGQGGMGEVHLALGPGVEGVEKRLAIKRLLPAVAEDGGLVERFLDEARIAVTLSHGNIVPVFEVGRVGREYFLVMECIDGTDLRRLLQHLDAGGRRLPVPLALYIALCVCQALDYVHRKVGPEGRPLGLVHRDVSPQNILVGFDGEVKLTDFGIARVAGRRQHTATGNLVGKFAYMSPEQASGLPLDGRTDQFALGIVLHEMLTGRRLFDGESDLALLRQVQQATIAVPSSLCPEVPPELDTLVMRMLARDPGARYPTMTEVTKVLGRLLFLDGAACAADLSAYLLALFPRGREHPGSLEALLMQGAEALPPPARATASLPGRGLSRGSTPRMWILGGLLGVSAAGFLAVALPWTPRQDEPPPPSSMSASRVQPSPKEGEDASVRAQQLLSPDGGSAPLPAASQEPPREQLPVLAASTPPRVPKRVAASRPRAPSSTVASTAAPDESHERGQGSLSLRVVPWGEIHIDGVKVAETSALVRHSLTAGLHRIVVRNVPLGREEHLELNVTAGESVVREINLSADPGH